LMQTETAADIIFSGHGRQDCGQEVIVHVR